MAGQAVITTLATAVARIIRVTVVLLAVVMLVSIGWQVLMRYAFNRPPSWSEELALLCFTWITLLMLAVGVREAFHAQMDLLTKCLPLAWQAFALRLGYVLIALFGMFLAFGGYVYTAETLTAKSAAMAYPIYLLHSAAPIAGLLILLFAIERLWVGPPIQAQQPEQAAQL